MREVSRPTSISVRWLLHFKNKPLRLLGKTLRIPHHFTPLYFSSSNGAVERIGRELLRVARALLSDRVLIPDTCPDTFPIFQSALNNSRSCHPASNAPISAFTGMGPPLPIKTFMSNMSGPVVVSDLIHERTLNVAGIHMSLATLHP